jgi:hypothetical protein
MNVNSVTSLLPSYLPFNSTANTANANSASSVQQQADVLSLPTADQFLNELQQVQSPQQFQAMISQATGQPIEAGATAGTTPTAKHCQGRGSPHAPSPSPGTTSQQNQSLMASIFGSINHPQTAVL